MKTKHNWLLLAPLVALIMGIVDSRSKAKTAETQKENGQLDFSHFNPSAHGGDSIGITAPE